ncbi:MAG: hypothetical protein KF865_14190 [Bdellovibrionaceae bacterium]|nr:hypothetical protein [Pseudobdellovibrionaceae bacterium]
MTLSLSALILKLLLHSVAFSQCPPPAPNEEVLRASDFQWSYSLPALITRFQEILASPRRLPQRAFWDESQSAWILPYDLSRGGPVRLPESFIRSVRRHLEEAWRLDYIDGVFFPDMGHSHFLIPQDKWDRDYAPIPVREMARLYEKMLADPELKILYHTAEQLEVRTPDGELDRDRRLQWRFYSRNLVGDNRGEGRLELLQNPRSRANTVSDVPGYRWWGAGFNVSAQRQGCFTARDARGETFRFDLSLSDLE